MPDDVETDRPSAARIYDYYLGGSHNFAVDREFAQQVVKLRDVRDRTGKRSRHRLVP